MWAPIRLNAGEGQRGRGKEPKRILDQPAGVMGTARTEASLKQRGRSAGSGRCDSRRQFKLAALAEVGEAHGTCEAANHGGGTGPYFWTLLKEARKRGLA